MAKFSLQTSVRDRQERVEKLRSRDQSKKAQLPAVAYGRHFASTPLTLDYSEFARVYKKAGHSNLVTISVNGKEEDVLIHDVQLHPVTDDIIHVDFYVVVATEAMTVKIPLHLTGTAPAVKEGALVDQVLHDLEVKCLPRDLVDHFDVDISSLDKIGVILHVSDLKIDAAKYQILNESNAPIVSALSAEIKEPEVVAPVVEGEAGAEGATATDATKTDTEEKK